MADPITNDIKRIQVMLQDFFTRSGKGFPPPPGSIRAPRSTSTWLSGPFEIDTETTATDHEGFGKIVLYYYGNRVGALRLYGIKQAELEREKQTLIAQLQQLGKIPAGVPQKVQAEVERVTSLGERAFKAAAAIAQDQVRYMTGLAQRTQYQKAIAALTPPPLTEASVQELERRATEVIRKAQERAKFYGGR